MTKTATVSIRIDEQTKRKTEKVLSSLGLTMSSAFNIFCHQVVNDNGIPFRITASRQYAGTTDISNMTDDELISELDKGSEAYRQGDYTDAKRTMNDLRRQYGL